MDSIVFMYYIYSPPPNPTNPVIEETPVDGSGDVDSPIMDTPHSK